MSIILNRRSVRKYDLSKKISIEDLKYICRCAEAAPSARRQKAREYIIVDDESLIKELSTVSKGSMILTDCNTLIVVLYKDLNTLTIPEMMPQDCSAAVENILLAATEKGFGSCWIGMYPINDRMASAKKILNITDERNVFAMIALGYPQDEGCFYDADKFDESVISYNRG